MPNRELTSGYLVVEQTPKPRDNIRPVHIEEMLRGGHSGDDNRRRTAALDGRPVRDREPN